MCFAVTTQQIMTSRLVLKAVQLKILPPTVVSLMREWDDFFCPQQNEQAVLQAGEGDQKFNLLHVQRLAGIILIFFSYICLL